MTFFAPGRVNLIGEHTDYNLGFVLPIAIDLGCRATAEPLAAPRLEVHSVNRHETRRWDLASLHEVAPSGDWSDYVLGVARLLPGLSATRLTVDSNVPTGSGLSSSAALEVSSALALGAVQRGIDLARLCRRAENEFVGVPCGIMDQYASVAGVEGAALLIDCLSLEIRPVPLPSGLSILAVNSMVKHELGASAYSDRVRECSQAASSLGLPSLREATPAQVETIADPLIRRRARHIVAENQRVLDFADACAAGDRDRLGLLFAASHLSMRDDYEISCPEIDFLVEAAGRAPGAAGSRMTGGGFGGCTVNLVRTGFEDAFEASVRQAYQGRFGIRCDVYRVRPSAGARPAGKKS